MKTRLLRFSLPLGLLLAALWTSKTYADAGTPLMWASMLQLFVGNAIIGLGEGFLLAWKYGARKATSVLVMIAANYFSTWVGSLGLAWWIKAHVRVTLYSGWMLLLLALVASLVISIILEWPFVLLCLRRQERPIYRSLRASAFLQCASYAVLVPLFYLASGTSLYTTTHLDRTHDFVRETCATCIFISPTDGDVYSRKLGSGSTEKVATLKAFDSEARMFVRKPEGAETWDLWAVKGEGADHHPEEVLVLHGFARRAAEFGSSWGRGDHEPTTWFNFGPAAELGTSSAWEFSTGFWPVEGLVARPGGDREAAVWISLETPFLSWPARNATALPGDQVLFQLGDQICIFDPASRKLSLLTEGRGPVVILDGCDE